MRRMLCAGLVVLAVCGPTGTVVAETPTAVRVSMPTQPHPCLFLTPKEVLAVRARFQTEPWAKPIGEKVIKEADDLLATKPNIPHQGGQWGGWYSCEVCGVKLKARSPTEHVCPKCGKVYSGGIYDAVYVADRHSEYFRAAMDLALAYVLDPKPAYAQRVRDILAEYASFYRDLPLHDYRGSIGDKAFARGARLTAQTLDESGLLIRAARAYDLVYDASCFTDADRHAIETNLLRAMVTTIQRNPWGRLNWQSRHNAAILSAGLVLRDEQLVDQAVNDPKNGFLFQMREGVLESGMWYEGSIGYHYGALDSHIDFLEAACRAGMDLYSLPAVKKMFLAPLSLLMPDRTFPPLNDGGRSGIDKHRQVYEVAFRRYGDALFGQLVHPRDNIQALFWGADRAPERSSGQLVLPSQSGYAEGLAILRDPAGKTALYLDYFKSTTQHTQPVRLHVLLYAQGDIRFVDPATMQYGHPMHEGWGRQTFAHNTVVVNEEIQASSMGELKAFATGDDWAIARAEAAGAYKGVVLDRTVLMRHNVIADVFRCSADAESTFDLPLHFRDALSGLPAGEPLPRLSDKPAYREAKDVKRLTGPLGSFSVATGEGRRIYVTVFDKSEVFEARGYGNDLTDLVPMIVRRQKGKGAVFVAVYQLLEKGEEPLKPSAKISPTVVVSFGDTRLAVGDDTVVTIAGARHVAGAEGSPGK